MRITATAERPGGVESAKIVSWDICILTVAVGQRLRMLQLRGWAVD